MLRFMPFSAACRLTAFMTHLLQETFGWRKTETTRRIAEVFPEKTASEHNAIRQQAARNFGRNLCEILNADTLDDTWARKNIQMDAALNAIALAREPGKGVLIVITHFGNWDLAGTILCGQNIPMCFIARTQKNPLTYQALQQARQHSGGLVLDRDDPKLIRKIFPFLAKNGLVAILIDLHARGPGEPHTFLNHPCRLANGLGLLAAYSGAAVLPIALYRNFDQTHIWQPLPLRNLSKETDNKLARANLLQNCLDDLSLEILKHPESYFWYNRRWVLEP